MINTSVTIVIVTNSDANSSPYHMMFLMTILMSNLISFVTVVECKSQILNL